MKYRTQFVLLESLESALDALAAEGWEFVSFVPVTLAAQGRLAGTQPAPAVVCLLRRKADAREG